MTCVQVGRTGSGKTCLVSWLAGLPGWNHTMGESPGVRVTQVSKYFWWVRCIKYFRGQIYWPCLLTGRGPGVAPQLATFKLQLWDAGDGAVRKYGHVYPVCRENSAAVILTFR